MNSALLRPGFTGTLAGKLAAGASMMLTSPHGQGRRRTLRDLRRSLPSSLRVVQANLRDCPGKLAPLLATMADQAGLCGVENLEELLTQLPPHALIILHNFDELQPGDASGFDARFFTALNSVRQRPGLSLLCVCERECPELPLSLEPYPLPPLTKEEVAAELARRGIEASEQQLKQIAAAPAPYSAIEAIAPERSE